MPPVAIVVLNFNGLDDTLKCLGSLKSVTGPAPIVILVDNASTVDPAAEARRAYPGLEVIRNAENQGYAGGNNRGIERALERGAEYVLVLNNDTVVAPSIVTALAGAFAADASLGIVGPVINFMDDPDRVMTDGVRFNPGPGTEFFRRIEVPVSLTPPAVAPVDIVNGCCLLVKAEVFRKVGMFDEAFFIVHEESDFCLRATRAGFRCAVLGQTLVWHKGSGSFDRSGRQVQRYFDTRNLYYLLRRHAGRVGQSRSFAASVGHYLLYAFYRYDIELEAHKVEAANAIVDGVYDAFRGRRGLYARGRRPGIGAIRGAFRSARWMARSTR